MRKLLLPSILLLAAFIDLALAFTAFINPEAALDLFHLSYNAETSFLAFVVGWFCLIISAVCFYAILLIRKQKPEYKMLVYILGIWWIFLGLAIFFVFKRTENLLLDSFKGLLLLIGQYIYPKNRAAKLFAAGISA